MKTFRLIALGLMAMIAAACGKEQKACCEQTRKAYIQYLLHLSYPFFFSSVIFLEIKLYTITTPVANILTRAVTMDG